MHYSSVKELVALAIKQNTTVAEIVIQTEINESEKSREKIKTMMAKNIEVLVAAIKQGKKQDIKSASGLIAGEAFKLWQSKNSFAGDAFHQVIVNALAVASVNACMGKIVAGPTAGACGIVPAVLLTLKEKYKLAGTKLAGSFFTAAGLGKIVVEKATLAGAEAGCQAECGVAAAMAAGAAVELMGGTPQMLAHAFALALKNLLGLVCDPVAGLVEVPCVKRNAFCATHALTAANMALAGIKSVIPADEVIAAMVEIGDLMPISLKETSRSGLAVTPTGLKIKAKLAGE